MSSFISLRDFVHDLAKQREMQSYLESQAKNVEVVKSFVGQDGKPIDCVKVETQPGLQGMREVATPPGFVATPGAVGPGQAAVGAPNQTTSPEVASDDNAQSSPPGTIPVRRVTPEQLARIGSLEKFFEKAPGGGALPPPPAGIR